MYTYLVTLVTQSSMDAAKDAPRDFAPQTPGDFQSTPDYAFSRWTPAHLGLMTQALIVEVGADYDGEEQPGLMKIEPWKRWDETDELVWTLRDEHGYDQGWVVVRRVPVL